MDSFLSGCSKSNYLEKQTKTMEKHLRLESPASFYPGYLLASSTMLHCFLGIAPIAFSPLYYFHFMYAPLRCLEFQSPGRCNGKWIGRYRGVLSGAISPPGLLLFLFLVLWMGLVLILGVLCSVFIFWFIFCSCRVEIVSVSVDSFCSFEVTRGRDNW